MAPEVRKPWRHRIRCLGLRQLGPLSLRACVAIVRAASLLTACATRLLGEAVLPRSMSYVDRLLLTLPSSAPQIADWFTGAAALTTTALPGWLPAGAIHLRVHSLCVTPQGCSAPAELHRLDGAAGVLVGSEHNLEHLANGSNTSEQLLRAHRRLGKRPVETGRPEASTNSPFRTPRSARPGPGRPHASASLGQPRGSLGQLAALCAGWPVSRPWFLVGARLPGALIGDFALAILEPPAERHGQSGPARLLTWASSRRAWQLWAAQHSQGEAWPVLRPGHSPQWPGLTLGP